MRGFLRWLLSLMVDHFIGIVSVLVICGAVAIVAWAGLWNAKRRAITSSIRHRVAQQACEDADFQAYAWRPCALHSSCFFCADERGVLTPVIAPKCAEDNNISDFLDECGHLEVPEERN